MSGAGRGAVPCVAVLGVSSVLEDTGHESQIVMIHNSVILVAEVGIKTNARNTNAIVPAAPRIARY